MSESLTGIINRLLPSEIGEEVRRNIDAAVQSHLEQMNLATREQLEIQEKILRRIRRKVEDLEKRLESMESAEANSSSPEHD